MNSPLIGDHIRTKDTITGEISQLQKLLIEIHIRELHNEVIKIDFYYKTTCLYCGYPCWYDWAEAYFMVPDCEVLFAINIWYFRSGGKVWWFGVPVDEKCSCAEGENIKVFVRVEFSDEDWFSSFSVYGSGWFTEGYNESFFEKLQDWYGGLLNWPYYSFTSWWWQWR